MSDDDVMDYADLLKQQQGEIRTRIPSEQYKKNWERIFGNRGEASVSESEGKKSTENSSGPDNTNKP